MNLPQLHHDFISCSNSPKI